MKIQVGGATLFVSQWIEYETVEELETALRLVGIQLEAQLVWDKLEPHRT